MTKVHAYLFPQHFVFKHKIKVLDDLTYPGSHNSIYSSYIYILMDLIKTSIVWEIKWSDQLLMLPLDNLLLLSCVILESSIGDKI